MSGRLKSILVEDFRSIRGTQRISLDAPAVLIHGPNGTGKTSLLSAIEFGLTGAVGSLARSDQDYLKFLPHKKSPTGKCRVVLEADSLTKPNAEMVGDGFSVAGAGLLDANHTQFFTERCYLPQAALGRLLEIYEHRDNRRSDSPLTRFVKELLGLEPLDALIDGLHACGDVRRLREPAPNFWAARSGAQELSKRVDAATKLADIKRAAVAELEQELQTQIDGVLSSRPASERGSLEAQLQALAEEIENRLLAYARRRRDLDAAADQLFAATDADDDGQASSIEAAAAEARRSLEDWQAKNSAAIQRLFEAVRNRFPDLPDAASDPASTHQAAVELVTSEVKRLQELEVMVDVDQLLLNEVDEAIRQGEARLTNIEAELSQGKGAAEELAQALTAISAHIHDENCPVCGRDFGEVSDTPLASHVSQEVQGLVSAAGRVQALIRDRHTTLAAVAQSQLSRQDLQAKALSPEQQAGLKEDLARFLEWRTSLSMLAKVATDGAMLQRRAAVAAGALSALNSRRTGLIGLRAELMRHSEELGVPIPQPSAALDATLQDLRDFIRANEVLEEARKVRLAAIKDTVERLSETAGSLVEAEAELASATDEEAISRERRGEADRYIVAARDLVSRAQALRTEKVRRVFNDELNSVWRDLFIRLAPDEEFVPAFALPETNHGPVEAVLETLYRSGGKGGNPRAMLSAGNLNTAALTLFLALNLSAKPVLPWLIIDDPVQSMDDVHIAQFAALLRTLKREGRQVILAVHDRQLFDYLALELSPTFNGDRLITVELGRSADGMTTAPWIPTVFEPDRAVAA